jgi:hypothetical protein
MSLRRIFRMSDERAPELAKERGRAGASAVTKPSLAVDEKLAAHRALVADRLREAQQAGAVLPHRVCLLIEGQDRERGEPTRRRHTPPSSASSDAVAWKGVGFVGGWAEATAAMEPRKKAVSRTAHSDRASPAWHKAMQLYPNGRRPAALLGS